MNRTRGTLMISLSAVLGLALLVGLGGCSSSDSGTSADGTTVTYTVALSGAQEVPPVVTGASGSATFVVDLSTGAVSGSVTFTGLSSNATAAHIHQAAAGVNGAVIVPLAGGEGLTAGVFNVPAGSVYTAAQLTALKTNGLYVNVHSVTNPGGEIRGQITTPPGVTY